MTETALQGAAPTESFSNFGLARGLRLRPVPGVRGPGRYAPAFVPTLTGDAVIRATREKI